WLGKSRSYEAKPISGRRSMASVRRSAPSCRASRAGTGVQKKIHTWPPFPDRSLERRGDLLRSARLEVRQGVLGPVRAVEVGGEERARFVAQERIHAGHELAIAFASTRRPAQVRCDDAVGYGNERLIRTLAALDPRFLARAGLPLVRTGRRVAGLPGAGVLPAQREDVSPTGEETPEECDLVG